MDLVLQFVNLTAKSSQVGLTIDDLPNRDVVNVALELKLLVLQTHHIQINAPPRGLILFFSVLLRFIVLYLRSVQSLYQPPHILASNSRSCTTQSYRFRRNIALRRCRTRSFLTQEVRLGLHPNLVSLLLRFTAATKVIHVYFIQRFNNTCSIIPIPSHFSQSLQYMDKNKRKPQFQIRKVPLRRGMPEKTPELYALDVHSICLPSRSRKVIWGSLHTDSHYQEQVNPQIIYSPAYQQLYSQYLLLREQHAQQKSALQQEIEDVGLVLSGEEEKKRRLQTLREGLYGEIEHLREGLNEVRDKNYNLHQEIYHQRGAHYMNVNGLSFLQGGEMSYEELLQMEEQMGNVPKGLTEAEIARIPTGPYLNPQSREEICCICFDELQQGEEVPLIQCQHFHHRDCLRDWLLKQSVCPICKQDITVI